MREEVLPDGLLGREEALPVARGLEPLQVTLTLAGGRCEFSARP